MSLNKSENTSQEQSERWIPRMVNSLMPETFYPLDASDGAEVIQISGHLSVLRKFSFVVVAGVLFGVVLVAPDLFLTDAWKVRGVAFVALLAAAVSLRQVMAFVTQDCLCIKGFVRSVEVPFSEIETIEESLKMSPAPFARIVFRKPTPLGKTVLIQTRGSALGYLHPGLRRVWRHLGYEDDERPAAHIPSLEGPAFRGTRKVRAPRSRHQTGYISS